MHEDNDAVLRHAKICFTEVRIIPNRSFVGIERILRCFCVVASMSAHYEMVSISQEWLDKIKRTILSERQGGKCQCGNHLVIAPLALFHLLLKRKFLLGRDLWGVAGARAGILSDGILVLATGSKNDGRKDSN